jgi:PIN domain nuclease of toxin-antitoxin system
MKLLLDTHTFLWFILDDKNLSLKVKNLIEDEKNEIFLSIVSLWEISIKTALGKLEINGSYATVINDVIENNLEILPLDFAHTVIQNQLPFYHKDPFDRIILAQAMSENMHLLSIDEVFDLYLSNQTIQRIW